MQQQPATSHEEGVPPAAATAARIAQGHAVAEQPPAADDDDAPRAAPLPLGDDGFPDEALAVVCGFLGLRELGRLACAARRFTEPTLTEPGGSGGAGGTKLSPIEEGARLQLAAGGGSGGGGGGIAAERLEGETWVRALWRVQYRLQFTSCGPEVVLSEEGALRLRERGSGSGAAAMWCLGTRARLRSRRNTCVSSVRTRGACCVGSTLRVVAACRPCLLSAALCRSVFSFPLLLPLRVQAPSRRTAVAHPSQRCAPSTRWSRARTTWR
jgi:hypothetical protein